LQALKLFVERFFNLYVGHLLLPHLRTGTAGTKKYSTLETLAPEPQPKISHGFTLIGHG